MTDELSWLPLSHSRDLYSNSADGMCILNQSDGRILDCNGAALKMLQAKNRSQLLDMQVTGRSTDLTYMSGASSRG